MLSRTGEYALRAMMHIARHADEGFTPGGRIAALAGVPRKYLSKILTDLVRTGVLEAAPGKTGGFRMTRPAEQIPLFDVLVPFEPLIEGPRRCPFGNDACGEDDPCSGHDGWNRVLETYARFLRETSVQDIAEKRGRDCGRR